MRYETLKALSDVFGEKREDSLSYDIESRTDEYLGEAQPAYNVKVFPCTEYNTHYYDRQGTYTIEDYLALPDEQRVELIDGVICDRNKINRKRIFGEPDFAIEIQSPSTWRKDFFIKGEKYLNAGVKEYWIVDPMKETVTTFFAIEDGEEDQAEVRTYTFKDKVPVGIFDGKCIIDFKAIKEQCDFLD